MRCVCAFILVALALAWSGHAVAQQTALGVAAPLSGDFAVLGEQMIDGARVAAGQSEEAVRIEEADTECSPEGGRAAARDLVEKDVAVVVGFLCTEAIEAALPLFKDAGIAVITPGVRTTTLTDRRERTGWPVFRIAPRADAERDAVARILTERWSDALFAIVDDGTIYGRELAENLRAEAELKELEPVFVDTFRPQLDNQIGLAGRLRRAGATHVFVGGDRNDIAILARDAAGMDYALTIAGGDVLRMADGSVPLAPGTLMIGLPQWQNIAGQETLDAFAQAGSAAEGYAIPAHAAARTAIEAARIAREQEIDLVQALSENAFETALGTLSFDAKGDLTTDFHRLFRYDGETFVEAQ